MGHGNGRQAWLRTGRASLSFRCDFALPLRMRLIKLSRRTFLRWIPLVTGLLILTASVGAQGLPGFSPEVQAALQQAAQRNSVQNVLTGDAVPLEGALDPTEYVVGPGDVFEIAVGTALPTLLSLTVSADGMLVVPSTGSFAVAGLTLAETRTQVLAGLRRVYRNVNSEVALARPRQFYVHVAGAVPHPGRHVVAPIARVEDALAASMDETSPVLVLQELRRAAEVSDEPLFLPALRSVEIRRRDGTTERVDLWRYYTSGDLRFNPYVHDGDAVHVPAFREDLTAVTVQGEVPNPGAYDYREGDTVLDLLYIANGSTALDRLGEVRLVRRDGRPSVTLSPARLTEESAENVALAPGDRLVVTPYNRRAGVAAVVGHVEYPGTYPIQSGETTLKSLLDMAGGLRPDALLHGAYLERRGSARSATYEPDQITPFRRLPLNADINPQAIEVAMEAEISALSRNSDLSFAGGQYYGRELLQPQRVSVDVGAALTGGDMSITLQDGDRLVIPRDPEAVLVVGQVGRPGYIPYRPGASADDYVALAGGLGSAATDTYVRETHTGRILPATDEPLRSGDFVFVDRIGVGDTPAVQTLVLQERNLAFQQERERAERRYRLIQTGATVIGTVAAVITAYAAIFLNDRTSSDGN